MPNRLDRHLDPHATPPVRVRGGRRAAPTTQPLAARPPPASGDPSRWLWIALAGIGVHQVQSLLDDPAERTFRAVNLGIIAWLAAGSPPLSPRARGFTWAVLSLPPLAGALFGHLVPIARGRPVPPSSETAALNFGGAALLLALGWGLATNTRANSAPTGDRP